MRRFFRSGCGAPWRSQRQAGLEPKALYICRGQNAFEVVVLDAVGQASGAALQAAWKARRGGRASPVLLVALYGQTPPFAVPLPTIRGN